MLNAKDALAAFEQYYGPALKDAAWRVSDGDLGDVPRPVKISGVEIRDFHKYEDGVEWHTGAKEAFDSAAHFFVVSYVLCYGFLKSRKELVSELSELLYQQATRTRLAEWMGSRFSFVDAPPPTWFSGLTGGVILRDHWNDGVACADVGDIYAALYWYSTG